MIDQNNDILELNPENLEKSLLQFNYFPFTHEQREEMPPIFGSEMLTKEVSREIQKVGLSKFRKENGFDVVSFKRTRHPGIPRILGIPHPKAYVDLVSIITENWNENISTKCQSENSILDFEIQSDFRIIVHNYNSRAIDNSVESTKADVDFGSAYRIKTDIANFYRSIYSHSLPWALIGIDKAKKNRDSSCWFNKIDKHTRICQRNETKGITIGPATSSIISEMILFPVDEHLRECGYRFYRYIDDYTAFTDDRNEADKFLFDLAKKLEEYALHLNPKKTSISEMPIQNAEKWVVEMNQVLALATSHETLEEEPRHGKLNYRQARLIIDKAILLGHENPDGSVAKYAFSAIIDTGVIDDETEKYVEDYLLKYSFYYPSLIPLIHRWLQKYPYRIHIGDRIFSILKKSVRSGNSDNIVWCIFYLIKNDAYYRDEVIDLAIDEQSSIVLLMAYVYAVSFRQNTEKIENWAKDLVERFYNGDVIEYDLDKHWIVLYQLFLDGKIEQPYKSQEDQKVFSILKKNNISFVDYDSKQLKTFARSVFERVPFTR